MITYLSFFFFSSRRRHTRSLRDWSSDVCSSDLDSIPSEHRLAWRMHRVEPGETLAAIAKQYGATAGSIQTTNNLMAGDQPSAGDHLVIPAAYHEPPAAKAPAKRALRLRGGRTTATP